MGDTSVLSSANEPSNGSAVHLDALVVGAGFGGCYLLHILRDTGLKVKLVDAQDGFGGVWRANHYPGARVDSASPYYLLSAPELINPWTWTERFPDADELRRYFEHVDSIWSLSKDCLFRTRITEVRYRETEKLWHIRTSNGRHLSCRWFFPATGSSHKQYIPDWAGGSKFRGEIYHPASWPREDPLSVLKDRRVAVIEAGSSAVQIVQESAKQSTSLTQFIRKPAQACPIVQHEVAPEEVERVRADIPSLNRKARSTTQGLPFQRSTTKTLDATPEE